MVYETLKVEIHRENGVAVVCLNRPHVLNALNRQALEDLIGITEEVERDSSVGAVIITGEGKAFCTGGDLKELKGLNSEPGQFMDFVRLCQKTNQAIADLSKPTIAAVNGYCLAGGLELAMVCDMMIAAEEAPIGDHHAKFNLLPGGGGSQRLPRIVGLQKGKELLFTGRIITGKEAESLGLVVRAVPGGELLARAVDLAAEIAAKPRNMIAKLKQIVNLGYQSSLPAALELEIQAIYGSLQDPERREGLEEFAKR